MTCYQFASLQSLICVIFSFVFLENIAIVAIPVMVPLETAPVPGMELFSVLVK